MALAASLLRGPNAGRDGHLVCRLKILATKHLPLSLAYPIWTGIGAVGSIIVGVVLFHDQLPAIIWAFVILLIVAIIGIKLTAGH